MVPAVADVRTAAVELVERASADPAAVLRAADELLESAPDDEAAAAALHHAAGMALWDLARHAESAARLRSAIAAAEACGDRRRSALATGSLALAVGFDGDLDGALELLDRAAEALHGVDLGRTSLRRSIVLVRAGRLIEAEEALSEAEPLLDAAGDALGSARLHNERGILRAYRDDYDAAQADLERAVELFDALGRPDDATKSRHNLGFVAGRRGDLPTALSFLDAAEAERRRLGSLTLGPSVDRLEVLLAARLDREADALARQLVDELERTGPATDLADARLVAAEVALVVGDVPRAAASAVAARDAFARQGRESAGLAARLVELRARSATPGPDDRDLLRLAGQLATELDERWPTLAADAWLMTGEAAIRADEPQQARQALTRAAASGRTHDVAALLRAARATALLACLDGDRAAVRRAVEQGLDALDAHRATLAATDLRAHASHHAHDLVELGVSVAAQAGDADQVLRLVERWRAGSTPAAVRPPVDDDLAATLAELRAVSAAASAPATSAVERAVLETRRVDLETAVSRRTRRMSPQQTTDRVRVVTPASVLGASERLVMYAEIDGRLLAVVTAPGAAPTAAPRLVELGPVAPIRAAARTLRFALSRLADQRRTPRSLEAAHRSMAAAAEELDGLLARPLGPTDATADLLVPTGALHEVPWPALPTWRARPLRTAPSLASLQHRGATERRGPAVLVAGPGLRHARAELDAVELQRSGPLARLDADVATAGRTRATLDSAAWAHIVCHGDFRGDSPLFSALHLADGRLVVHDLESVERLPALVILSACGAGRSGATGDAVLGLATSLLGMGVRTVVAPVLDVPDEETVGFMADLHAGLERGASVPDALVAARAGAMARGTFRDLVVASAVVAMGDAQGRA